MSGSGGSDDWKTRGTSSGSSHPTAEGAEGKPKGGPGTAGGGGGGAAGSSKCEILEETVLNSPDASVIKTLRPGDILSLQQQGRSVVATTIQGQKAGSITFRRLADLLECMGLHYTYVAEVRRITGGTCQVWIHPDQRP
jgi:hypothetical protein